MGYYQGDYYQGDYYQGDVWGRLRKWGRKTGRKILRAGVGIAGFAVGGPLGAAAASSLTRTSKDRTRPQVAESLDQIVARLTGTPVSIKPVRAKGAAKRAPARRAAAAPARRPISPLMRSRGATTTRARVMSPYRRNQLARARAAAARGRR